MSPLGKSGGRSSGNKLGQGATRRATPRQREGVDPIRYEIKTGRVLWLAGWSGVCVLAGVGLGHLVGVC